MIKKYGVFVNDYQMVGFGNLFLIEKDIKIKEKMRERDGEGFGENSVVWQRKVSCRRCIRFGSDGLVWNRGVSFGDRRRIKRVVSGFVRMCIVYCCVFFRRSFVGRGESFGFWVRIFRFKVRFFGVRCRQVLVFFGFRFF